MKKIFFILIFVMTATLSAQQINWITMDEALAAQKEIPKKIFMDVYTSWCGPCKMLDKNTFVDKDVVAFINEELLCRKV